MARRKPFLRSRWRWFIHNSLGGRSLADHRDISSVTHRMQVITSIDTYPHVWVISGPSDLCVDSIGGDHEVSDEGICGRSTMGRKLASLEHDIEERSQ